MIVFDGCWGSQWYGRGNGKDWQGLGPLPRLTLWLKSQLLGFLINTGIPLYSVIINCRGYCAASDFSNNTGSLCAVEIRCDSFLSVIADSHGGVLAALSSSNCLSLLHAD